MKFSIPSCVESCQNKIDQGPCYICVVCDRTFYKKSVTTFKSSENNFGKQLATNVLSYDNKKHICMTCRKKTRKNKMPCQAVFNKLEISDVLQELNFEQIRESQRLLFKKIAIIPEGQILKIRGAIFNIAVDVQDICNSLPRNPQSSGIVLVKLF